MKQTNRMFDFTAELAHRILSNTPGRNPLEEKTTPSLTCLTHPNMPARKVDWKTQFYKLNTYPSGGISLSSIPLYILQIHFH